MQDHELEFEQKNKTKLFRAPKLGFNGISCCVSLILVYDTFVNIGDNL